MLKWILAAAAACALVSTPADARPRSGHGAVTQFCGDRVCGYVEPQRRRNVHHGHTLRQPRKVAGVRIAGKIKTQILPHPPGCPASRFCGCGVALHVFGKPVRSLYLASNWMRFPRAEPGPGMVAARRGHVFAIIRVVGPGRVLAYDPNSGRRLTRIHVRSLAGFVVVNPRAGNRYASG